MRYLLGIPYVNRPDLLRLAVNSVQPRWDHAFIVDNSEGGEISRRRKLWPIKVIRVPRLAPLTFSQTMNYLQNTARARKCEACLFMHNDAEAHPGTAERFLAVIAEALRAQRPWGAAFTNYDTLAAFNMQAVRETGPWDINLPQYYSDNDYYRRLRLAGFEIIETGLEVTHHNEASSTIKSDAKRAFLNSVTFPLYAEYYRQKWGGDPGSEQFIQPFNSDL